MKLTPTEDGGMVSEDDELGRIVFNPAQWRYVLNVLAKRLARQARQIERLDRERAERQAGYDQMLVEHLTPKARECASK
jgi:hypothetical protein